MSRLLATFIQSDILKIRRCQYFSGVAMSDDMLHDILEIERRIEAELAKERAQAEKWSAEQKSEIDKQTEKAMREAASVACQEGAGRCQVARTNGAARIRAMRQQVRKLKALPDVTLKQALKRHLSRITERSSP